jgi:hypothetical protein
MPKQGWLTKTLAIAGTFLAWLPILTLVIITGAMLIQRGEFHFDYLIPAELFPVFLGGGLLLLWASIRVKRYRMWIGVGLGAAVFFLVAGQGIAVITGLASGVTRPGSWQSSVVLGLIFLYDLAVIAVGVGGIRLIRSVFGSESSIKNPA